MSQAGILEFLSKNKKRWIKAAEIQKALGITNSSVQRSLSILRRFKLVKFKDQYPKVVRHTFWYKHKEEKWEKN